MNTLQKRLADGAPLIIDGGLATQLETMGHDIGSELWSAAMLISDPGAIVEAHRAYLDAGADIIISASYQASRAGFMSHGYDAEEADRLVRTAVDLARTACDQYLQDHPRAARPLVAASVGPWGAVQHDGSEYTGDYRVSDDELRQFHAQRLAVLDAAGADLLAVETIPNGHEARVLSELLQDLDTPAWVSFACRDEHALSDGTPLAEAAERFADHDDVIALGVNCTPPQYVAALIPILRRAAPDKAIVVYPNSGETYHSESNSWSGAACDLDRDFDVNAWRAAGAHLVGGCCRTGPRDIQAIKSRLTGQP